MKSKSVEQPKLSSYKILVDSKLDRDLTTIYCACDGGALANGKPECSASHASIAIWSTIVIDCNGLVDKLDIKGQVYKTSNNRGELLAMINTLKSIKLIVDGSEQNIGQNISTINAITTQQAVYTTKQQIIKAVIYFDSNYVVDSITKWYASWIKNGQLASKLNIDMISECYTLYNDLLKKLKIEFVKIKSHKSNSTIGEALNHYVDQYCQYHLSIL
jgi:ribonuclease HI